MILEGGRRAGLGVGSRRYRGFSEGRGGLILRCSAQRVQQAEQILSLV